MPTESQLVLQSPTSLEEAQARRATLTAALRSDKYKQGKGYLQPELGSFCCQGVGCDLLDSYWFKEYDDRIYWRGMTFERTTTWPVEVRLYYGINQDDSDKLAAMNDSGVSFSEIADFIDGLTTWQPSYQYAVFP